jgi:hypothetical protein
MSITTDLNTSPYFDDFSEDKDYYKILFQPGVSVQTRELNQLQTILQKQIERFGDNIFKRGTIIDGCDITFHSMFPYVKIKDSETNGTPVNVGAYLNYYVKNQANVAPLIGRVVTAISGYEATTPDLNTLYVKYLNTGYSNVASTLTAESVFSESQTLTVYDPNSIIERVVSYDDSSGFANTDTIVFTSAIAIQNTTGGTTFANNYYVGDYINNGVANAQVISVDTSTNTQVVILGIAPKAADLKVGNSQLWTFTVNNNIVSTNAAPASIANVVSIVGSGASATLKTGALGEVDSIVIASKGSGYYVLPKVSISSNGATTGQISSANLAAQSFLSTITVANSSMSPVGMGYAMSVGNGIIYQKGYFSSVDHHLVVVDKYANTPDLVSVGFQTLESIVNADQDTSLFDNAIGEPNFAAPGADRLKLTPKLVVLDKAIADANNDFLYVAEFSNGQPYKQNRQTVYNVIDKEISRRTYDATGNYVLDKFNLNTISPALLSDEVTQFNVQIDPGLAYIDGERIETTTNYLSGVQKGTDTIVSNNAIVSLNFGNYVRVNEFAGNLPFSIGGSVDLYDTAATFITSGSFATINSSGTQLGSARIRSVVNESGIPGDANAVYRLYLFDIRLNAGKNFSQVRSIYYSGTNKGICDVVLENGLAVLKDNNLTSLLYYAGYPAVKAANNLSYIYRTSSNTLSLATNGTLVISVSGGETFPYTGTLSTTQEKELIIIPLANAVSSANIAGTVSCNTTSAQVNGSSTSFTSDLASGDFLRIGGSTIVQVNNIVNNTVLFTKSNPSAGAAANGAYIYFPQNIPISLDRSTRTANTNVSANTLTVNINATLSGSVAADVYYNVKSSNTTPVTKTVKRDRYVRLRLANNATSNTGPWALGVSDAFRLSNVYLGSNATFTGSDTGVTDVTQYFYVDHNQTEDYYGISYLYKTSATYAVQTSDYLLVKFDYMDDSAEGLKDIASYNIDDTLSLSSSASSLNTLEIPEVYGNKGTYYDLRDQFDFRPKSANTVSPNTAPVSAPLNPTEPATASRFSTTVKKFPAPDSILTGTIEYYVGRSDRALVDKNGELHVVKGTPGSNTLPPEPQSAITINTLSIPPYPTIPAAVSANTILFLNNRIANEKFTKQRVDTYRVSTGLTSAQTDVLQPRGYTMEQIGKLERRIADLEYYNQFTLKETLTQKKVIPASANSSIDRFKFGFFVDAFDDYNYADINNPGYTAAIIDGSLSPAIKEINITTKPSTGTPDIPYTDHPLISQPGATDGPIANTSSGSSSNTSTGTIISKPSSNNSSNTTQAYVFTAYSQRSTNYSKLSPYVYDDFIIYSTSTETEKLWMGCEGRETAIEIFESTSADGPWTSITTSATAQYIDPTVDLGPTTWGKEIAPWTDLHFRQDLVKVRSGYSGSTVERKSYGPVGDFIADQYKMSWTKGSVGKYTRIRVYKGDVFSEGASSYVFYTYGLMEQLISSSSSPDTPALLPATLPTTMIYGGWVSNIEQDGLFYQYTSSYFATRTGANYTAGYVCPNSQSLHITFDGLKPNTKHRLYLNGVALTRFCKLSPQISFVGVVPDYSLGVDPVSNINGRIELTLYLDSSVMPADYITSGFKYSYQPAWITGPTELGLTITNVDGLPNTSSTQFPIVFKKYT